MESTLAHQRDVADGERRAADHYRRLPIPGIHAAPQRTLPEDHEPDGGEEIPVQRQGSQRGGRHDRERHQSGQNMQSMRTAT